MDCAHQLEGAAVPLLRSAARPIYHAIEESRDKADRRYLAVAVRAAETCPSLEILCVALGELALNARAQVQIGLDAIHLRARDKRLGGRRFQELNEGIGQGHSVDRGDFLYMGCHINHVGELNLGETRENRAFVECDAKPKRAG